MAPRPITPHALTRLLAHIVKREVSPTHRRLDEALDGLLRDRPRPTALSKLRNRFRRRFTPGEVQRLEQNRCRTTVPT
jgi:hypothetical protein